MTATDPAGLARPTLPGAAIGPPGRPAVVVVDETMREGLQIEDAAIPLADRVRLLDALSQTGLRRIVVGSFVSPKWTPQMAEIDALLERFTPVDGVIYTALALNAKGAERRARHLPPLSLDDPRPATFVHLCDVFVRRNANRSQADEIAGWQRTVDAAVAAGATEAQISVNAAWGSNWLGPFSAEQRLDLLARQHALWERAGIPVTKVFLGDPMGWNLPHHVVADVRAITARWPSIETFHLHLHNTRGTAPISSYCALQALDARHTVILDASLGGMAGCPYCGNGRAAGLVPTEDLVDLLQESGYATGVSVDALIDAVALAEQVVGHPLAGHVSKAGRRPRGDALYAMDMPFVETLEQAQHFRLGAGSYAGAMSPWREPIASPARDAIAGEGAR